MRKFLWFGLPILVLGAFGVLWISLKSSGKGCCGPVEEATGEYFPNEKVAVFSNQPVEYALAQLAPGAKEEKVMGAVSEAILAQRWIEIDLSEQKLYAHEGDEIVYVFLISSGKWGRTPTGDFQIWGKYRYTKMSGGSKALHTYYYLPNVPYTQYFYKDFGLHGAYWHNNFGEPMSHGCINLSIPDAEKLFWWTAPTVSPGVKLTRASDDSPGTRVVIHE